MRWKRKLGQPKQGLRTPKGRPEQPVRRPRFGSVQRRWAIADGCDRRVWHGWKVPEGLWTGDVPNLNASAENGVTEKGNNQIKAGLEYQASAPSLKRSSEEQMEVFERDYDPLPPSRFTSHEDLDHPPSCQMGPPQTITNQRGW